MGQGIHTVARQVLCEVLDLDDTVPLTFIMRHPHRSHGRE